MSCDILHGMLAVQKPFNPSTSVLMAYELHLSGSAEFADIPLLPA
jgi:hypothetical protein